MPTTGDLFGFEGNKVELEKIFQENTGFHREILPDDEVRSKWDWEVFLGAYHTGGEEQFFDFSFGDSGYKKAAITKCEVDYTGVTLDPNAIDGIIPSQKFYERLEEFGCFCTSSCEEKALQILQIYQKGYT